MEVGQDSSKKSFKAEMCFKVCMLIPLLIYTLPSKSIGTVRPIPLFFAVDWKHLGLTSKDEYEMRD